MARSRFTVYHKDGSEVKVGDKLSTFNGDEYTYYGCYHPRKVCVRNDKFECGREFYPNVLGLTIKEEES